mgnify:CR=1 FL=1
MEDLKVNHSLIFSKFIGYWYEEGYFRTSSDAFTLNNIENTFIHLTNDAV